MLALLAALLALLLQAVPPEQTKERAAPVARAEPRIQTGEYRLRDGQPLGRNVDAWSDKQPCSVERCEGRYLFRKSGRAMFWLDPASDGTCVYAGNRERAYPSVGAEWFIERAALSEGSVSVEWRDKLHGERRVQVFRYEAPKVKSHATVAVPEEADNTSRTWPAKTAGYRWKAGVQLGRGEERWGEKTLFHLRREKNKDIYLLSRFDAPVCSLSRNEFGDLVFGGNKDKRPFAQEPDLFIAEACLGKQDLRIYIGNARNAEVQVMVLMPE
jgi:hypothetical protein